MSHEYYVSSKTRVATNQKIFSNKKSNISFLSFISVGAEIIFSGVLDISLNLLLPNPNNLSSLLNVQ